MMMPFLATIHHIANIRLAIALFGLFVIVLTFESIRRTALKERYALLWIVPCILLLLLTAFPDVLDWMHAVFGLTYGSSIGCVTFASLMAAVFYLSRAISKNERNVSKLAQRCAQLEARIRELESRKKD